jgi:hypothetical protein
LSRPGVHQATAALEDSLQAMLAAIASSLPAPALVPHLVDRSTLTQAQQQLEQWDVWLMKQSDLRPDEAELHRFALRSFKGLVKLWNLRHVNLRP